MTTHDDDARPPRQYGGHGRFEDRLEFGDECELAVAKWLEAKGRRVMRLSRGPCDGQGGPRLHTISGGAVTAPDLLVTKPVGHHTMLLEVKGRKACTFHTYSRSDQTGIKLAELDCCEAAEAPTGLPVWIGFVQLGKRDRFVERAPAPPSGLFVAPVAGLRARASHIYGNAQMIYWRLDDLCHIASLDDLGVAP